MNINDFLPAKFYLDKRTFQQKDEIEEPTVPSDNKVPQPVEKIRVLKSGEVINRLLGEYSDNESKTIDPFTRKLITVSEFKTKYGDGNQKIYVKNDEMIIGYEQMTMNEYCKRYTIAINPPEAFWEMPQKKESRKADDLLSMGFTQAQLSQYFDKKESQIGGEVYILKDNIVIKSKKEGDIKITSVEDLAEYVGANSRKSLKDKGLTDEVIDKYFKLMLNGNSGKATYALNYKYKSYSVTKGDNFTDLYLNTMDGKSIKVHIDSDGNITITNLAIKVHIDSRVLSK